MKIAIIGAGNVGGALALRWQKAGHIILIGARDVESPKIQKIRNEIPSAKVSSIQEAAQEADVILVAIPPQFAEDLAAQMGKLPGKVVIDATNAVRTRPENYPTAFHALAALTEAEVVKCFNTTGFENMQNPNYGDTAIEVYMSGDSVKAKQIVRQLALDAGFAECYDFGAADKVLLQEQFALAWINLAIMQGMGRDIALKLIRRKS
jgi:predicted dinucleotide-binding enzyme